MPAPGTLVGRRSNRHRVCPPLLALPACPAGIDEQGFRARAEGPLLEAVTQRVLSQPPFTFVQEMAMVPAGTALRSLPAASRRALRAAQAQPAAAAAAGLRRRRALQQEGEASSSGGGSGGGLIPRWLEVIIIAGGTDPIQMYYTSQQELT